MNVNFIVGTSCAAERLFSAAAQVLTDNRKSMSDELFEAIMLLKSNSTLWDAESVGIAMNRNPTINVDDDLK